MSDTNTVAPEQPQYSKLRVGLMLGAVIMLLLIKGFGNYKFVPMQTLIMEFYNVGESAYGYLNTASGWVTTICVIPFAFIVRKIRIILLFFSSYRPYSYSSFPKSLTSS